MKTFIPKGWMLNIIYGANFSDAKNILEILSALPILIGLENLFVILWMLPHGLERVLIRIQFLCYFILILVSFIFFDTLGAEAPAIAVIISQILLILCAIKVTLPFRK
jgi:O-antigen/teichoic acid export membrane protein